VPEHRDLESLSSRELHDLAVRRAVHHLDAGFLWQLLREIPAARAAAGQEDAATADVAKASALIADALDSGAGEIAEELRPMYIAYLEKHSHGKPGED
jgi:hypothetical protein